MSQNETMFERLEDRTLLSVSPIITASQTSGIGPLYVSFDAVSSTGFNQQADLINSRYQWDFDYDPAGGGGTDPNGRYEKVEGMVAGHVFEKPGTYTVRLVLTDVNGVQSVDTEAITVSAFSGATYYVAADGSDAANGLTEQTAFATAGKGISALAASSGPAKLLFRRGDTFNTSGLSLTGKNDGHRREISHYGSASLAMPTIVRTSQSGSLLSMGGTDNLVISGIRFEGTGTGGGYGRGIASAGTESNDILIYDNFFKNMGERTYLSEGLGSSDRIGFFFNQIERPGSYGLYFAGGQDKGSTRVSIVGNKLFNSPGDAQNGDIDADPIEHAIRFQGMMKNDPTSSTDEPTDGRYYIGYNDINLNEYKSSIQIRGQSRYVSIVGNSASGKISVNPTQTAVGFWQLQRDVQIEGNYLFDDLDNSYDEGSTYNRASDAIIIKANRVVVRNNVVDNYKTAVNLYRHPEPLVGSQKDIYIYIIILWRLEINCESLMSLRRV